MADEGRWPYQRARRGQRRCKVCGEAYAPLPRARLNLCPYDRRLHDARRERRKKLAWLHRHRRRARASNGAGARRPSP